MTGAQSYLKSIIRRRYAGVAVGSEVCNGGYERALQFGYRQDSLASVPRPVIARWSGCGPLAESLDLHEAATVADLGCGSGLDVWLLAKRDSPPRRIFAVDLTPEMLELIAANGPDASGCETMFVAADMEQLPLPDSSCDLVIANAAFNLAVNKRAAYEESARILRPGGRLFTFDLVRQGALPAEILTDPLGHGASLGGVITEREIRRGLDDAGFTNVKIRGHRSFPPVIAVEVEGLKPPLRGVR